MVTRYGQTDVPREVSGRGGPVVRPAAADSPRDVCLTVSRNHAVFLLYHIPNIWPWVLLLCIMPQSHPTMSPIRILAPIRFLAHKAEWSARRNSMSVLFSWSHQATGPIHFDTAVNSWFDWIIHRTPHGPRVKKKILHGRRMLPYWAHTAPERAVPGCLRSLNPVQGL